MSRSAASAIALSLLSLPFLLPHVIEDFQLGIARRVGLGPGPGAAVQGAGLAAQMLGLVLIARGRRAGLAVTGMAGAVWTAGGSGITAAICWPAGWRFGTALRRRCGQRV